MTGTVTTASISSAAVAKTSGELDPVRSRLADLGRPYLPADVADAMRSEGQLVSDEALLETVDRLRRDSIGAGPLEALLRDPTVTDVLVNGPDQVFVDRGSGLQTESVRIRRRRRGAPAGPAAGRRGRAAAG